MILDKAFLDAQRTALTTLRENLRTEMSEGRAQVDTARRIARASFALMRLKEGQYGICTNCGCLIEVDLLRMIPEVPFCSDCLRQREGH